MGMGGSFWDALAGLPLPNQVFFAVALAVAFGFEFINGFHDTANGAAVGSSKEQNEQEDLTAQQLRVLGRLVREEFR
jgi:phosphate/sulfate permease